MFSPFIWMLSSALKTPAELFQYPPQLLPPTPEWNNFTLIFTKTGMGRYFANTTIVTAINLLGVLLSCPLAAYAFARLRARGRDLVFGIMLSTMVLPAAVTMIPLFIIFQRLGWLNTYLPLTVPAFFGNAFYIFLLRQFFLTIPRELEDAARIDGCGYFSTYWRIMLPQVVPALLTVAVFNFTAVWNDFLFPVLFLDTPDKYTLSLGLTTLWTEYNFGAGSTSIRYDIASAAAAVVILPCVILFLAAQRYFVQGITLTGIKG
jgi:ABC-type glycerol-3-phosphate transport system permease component